MEQDIALVQFSRVENKWRMDLIWHRGTKNRDRCRTFVKDTLNAYRLAMRGLI